MVLLGAVILPHGAMPYDGDLNSSSPSVRERQVGLDPRIKDTLTQLYDGICTAASAVAELEADLYILHTAHGICLSESYGVYVNTSVEGDASWLDQWSEFKAKAPLDQPHSKELKDFLKSAGVDVQTILCYGRSESAKIRWSEAIPIWYLQQFIKNEPKYMIIAEDTRPSAGHVEQFRLDIGLHLAEFINRIPEKVVVVISGDLSHCHPTNPTTDSLYLPDPWLWDFPADKEAAESFDEAVACWSIAGTDDRWQPELALPYLHHAAQLDPRALSCGIKGFIVLHGLLAEFVRRGTVFVPRLTARHAPTYYGMMAATFIINAQ